MAVITLTTDFGLRDTYVGVMKGVILGIAPEARIVDLTHEVPPQEVLTGALLLASAVEYFPAGTIHVAVVDPGVGSERAAVAVQTGRAVFVGPDNGLLSLAIDAQGGARKAVRLTSPKYHLPAVSATFHGRDVFAPVAAHLARGVKLAELGEPAAAADLVRLELPRPSVGAQGLRAQVMRVDHFGNLVTNLTRVEYETWRGDAADAEVGMYVARRRVRGVGRTFADVPRGKPVAYFGSSGVLEIAVRDGNAAREFGVRPGAEVVLRRAEMKPQMNTAEHS